jgi:paraquat-inducible protein B
MSNKASPTAIGGFVIGIIGLAIALLFFFGGGDFFADSKKFDLIYRTSIKGLKVGAPVTIKGVKIGEVTSVKAQMFTDQLNIYNVVTINIQTEAMARVGQHDSERELLDELLDKGLGAQLKLQSLLTGLLFVDVDFHASGTPHYEDIKTANQQFPTVATDFEALSKNLETIDLKGMADDIQHIFDGLDHIINNPRTQNMGDDITSTLHAYRELAEQLNKNLSPLTQETQTLISNINKELPELIASVSQTARSLEGTAKNLEQSMTSTQHLLSDDSPLLHEITAAARGLKSASAEISELAHTLNQQPEALIKGKRGE